MSSAQQLLDRIDYWLVETNVEREAIFRLRYRAYLNEGAIEPNPEGLVTDHHDDLPNSWIFGIHVDGVLLGSIRISVASPSCPTSPSVDVFSDILGPELERGKTIVDPTQFVADRGRVRRMPELLHVPFRLVYIACCYFDADIVLATVRAEHQAYYRRYFFAQPLCEPRLFPGLLKPVGLMAGDFRELQERVHSRFAFIRSSAFERRKFFERTAPIAATEDCI